MKSDERYILVVDADPASRREIVASLGQGTRHCVEVDEAQRALEMAKACRPDLVIADSGIRDASGLSLCRLLRSTPGLDRVPLLVVSRQSAEIDRILAFEVGADDFLAKPFYPRELAARVRVLLRGAKRHTGAPRDRDVGSLYVDFENGRLEAHGRHIDLTRTELQILAELLAPAGIVVRRRDLIERLWGPGASISGRAIDAHIKNIRRKLGQSRVYLETVRGVGYRIEEWG